ncbi:type I glyceraldehyde-3-phosphate dehydrogenase [Candidatus Parcubacteria bacterium]|nr:type I glyceraldehyde-3-phosphate dehydrogenase [Candidatus Parcubacteria bacterium]
MNIAINGFGRIGRAVFKIMLENKKDFNVVAINDLTDTKTLAHLLKYDTCYGRYEKNIECSSDSINVSGKKYKILAEKDPAQLPWNEMAIDIVLECTGRFRTKQNAGMHIKAGAKKVIISAPGKGDGIKTIVLGVNEKKINKNDKIISNASCTTNCLAPVTQIIKDNFGIKKAVMSTIHSYTADQNLVDGPHTDLRRARAAAQNIIPTTTGAAIATTQTIPSLKNKFDGMAIRVPTPVGSLVDVCFITKKKTDERQVNQAFKKAARGAVYKNYIEASEEPLVLADIVKNSASAIVDLNCTKVVDGDLVKVIAWYDNEWGYAGRLVDLCGYIGRKKYI